MHKVLVMNSIDEQQLLRAIVMMEQMKCILIVLSAVTVVLLCITYTQANQLLYPYSCVWNSPSVLCARYGLHFQLSQFHIVQNINDQFNGGNITILYGPGKFPKINHSTGTYTNGGIPQLGNLSLHLQLLESAINSEIPDKEFSGLAVLDFEAWRPLYKHNFDLLSIYQKASEELVRKNHPDLTNSTAIKLQAEKEFNSAARMFFESTLNMSKELRPNAKWGYYGFPRCYGQPGNYCAPESQDDNDLLGWLWEASTALYPRIYLSKSPAAVAHQTQYQIQREWGNPLNMTIYSKHNHST